MAAYGGIRLFVNKFAVKMKIINKRWESKLKSHEIRFAMIDYTKFKMCLYFFVWFASHSAAAYHC